MDCLKIILCRGFSLLRLFWFIVYFECVVLNYQEKLVTWPNNS